MRRRPRVDGDDVGRVEVLPERFLERRDPRPEPEVPVRERLADGGELLVAEAPLGDLDHALTRPTVR